MYKELIFVNNQNKWNFVLDISLTEHKNLYEVEDVQNFINSYFNSVDIVDILIDAGEVFLVTNQPIPCFNCSETKNGDI